MSGHNKWSTIKHKKAATDAKRSKVWTKIIRELTVAARMGGGDPHNNPRLRTAIDKGRAANMPNDTVDRAIKKGTGEGGDVHYDELVYEVYGPGGAALLVEVMTDNKNRCASEIRNLLERNSGKLAAAGAVAYLFKKRGNILIERAAADEDKLMELALEAGAEDVKVSDEGYEVVTDAASYAGVKDAITKAGIAVVGGEVGLQADTTIKLEGKDAAAMAKLVSLLEDQDDVQNVSSNAELDEAAQAG